MSSNQAYGNPELPHTLQECCVGGINVTSSLFFATLFSARQKQIMQISTT